MGAASADAVYGAIAGFGLTAVSSALVGHETSIRLLGGAFLLYLGAKTLRSEPAEGSAAPNVEADDRGGLAGDYASTFLLTLTNPVTILAFVGIFAGLGVGVGTDYGAALALVAGVFAGSALWWLLLAGGVSLLRARFTPTWMGRVSQLAGAILVGFGLLALWSVIR